MASLNKVQLMGNLGTDPEVRTFPDGSRIATATLATNDRRKDKESGETKEHTEWHRVVFKGRVVDAVEKHLHKGATIYLEGANRTRKWQDKEGKEHYSTEVVTRSFQFLDKKDSEGVPANAGEDDDIPL